MNMKLISTWLKSTYISYLGILCYNIPVNFISEFQSGLCTSDIPPSSRSQHCLILSNHSGALRRTNSHNKSNIQTNTRTQSWQNGDKDGMNFPAWVSINSSWNDPVSGVQKPTVICIVVSMFHAPRPCPLGISNWLWCKADEIKLCLFNVAIMIGEPEYDLDIDFCWDFIKKWTAGYVFWSVPFVLPLFPRSLHRIIVQNLTLNDVITKVTCWNIYWVECTNSVPFHLNYMPLSWGSTCELKQK